jgi:hypothetical protein
VRSGATITLYTNNDYVERGHNKKERKEIKNVRVNGEE